ncbi:MAG: RNA polymerase sigma factor [Porphyromonadaceae bacterium]|nr:RNA polymerase sigma factor [Porphyromonadaceae bacterium]
MQLEQDKTKSFSEIVQTFQERLYWHIRQMVLVHDDANDILQNTFLKAWNGLDKFRGDSQLSTWLYRIATNETLTFLAQKRMRNVFSIDETEDLLFNNLQADSFFDGDEAQLKLQKAILTLPEKQRLVFNMRFYEEMPYDQMSEILGTSVGALKASYHHAAKKVEEFLKKE